MSEEYGANFITVTDDEGNEFELEHLDTMELNGTTYMAFFPAVTEEEQDQDEDLGLIFMKVIVENGEELLSTLDTDEEAEMVYNAFMEELFEDEDGEN